MNKNQNTPKGNVRKIDELGRLVIPMDIRKSLDIRCLDKLEISVENDEIRIKKLAKTCVFCGSGEGISEFKESFVCESCLKELCNGSARCIEEADE